MHDMKEFLSIYDSKITRDGSKSLREWLTSTSFATDPASTRFHGNSAGCLCDHSVNVYYRLKKLLPVFEISPSEETIAIVSLLHDLCKIGKYKVEMRNVKENGCWVSKPFYKFVDDDPLGYHGPASVFLINKYIDLSDEEIAAIANHMGAYDRAAGDYTLTPVFQKYQLAFLLHTADSAASFYDEHTEE